MVTAKGKKYVWASIVWSCSNYGNCIIERCLKGVLGLPEPDLVVDALRDGVPDLSGYHFMINPGSTTLYPDNALFARTNGNLPPTVCFGGSISHMGECRKHNLGYISVARKMVSPVGCRDPFTYEVLSRNNIDAHFIGCPTLHCSSDNNSPCDYIVFSFGKGNISAQRILLRQLTRRNRVKVLVHESCEAAYCRGIPVAPISDTDRVLEAYYHARYVVTGRLHGALPAISAHRPVYFFRGTRGFDSRLTLLHYLGLPVQDISDMFRIGRPEVKYDWSRVERLKQNFADYVVKFRKDFGV